MKLSLTVIITCLTISTYCQETFFKYFPDSRNEGVFSLVEDQSENYFLAGFATSGEEVKIGSIYKVDKNGNLISRNILPENAILSSIFLSHDQSYFILAGTADSVTSTDTISRVSICTYDTAFNMISKGTCSLGHDMLNFPQEALLLNDSIIYILSATYSDIALHFSLLKYRIPSDSLAYFESPLTGAQSPSDLIFINNNENILVSYGGSSFERNGITKILKLDNNLNYVSVFEPDLAFMNVSGLHNNTDTSFLITSTTVTLENNVPHQIIAEYNYNFELLKSFEFPEAPYDTMVYCAIAKNLEVSDSVIWNVGYYNMRPEQYPWQFEPTWIQINRLSKSFELISQHFYGGDAFYLSTDIQTTHDGGVVIAGNRFDYNAVPFMYQKDPFILKVNGEGLIVNTQTNNLPGVQEALVYPNPGEDFLKVKLAIQHHEADLKLYSVKGELRIETRITAETQEIPVYQLESGTYLYVITSGERIIASGKWIKK